MAKILIIDTAIDTARVTLCENERVLAELANDRLKEQAGWLQPAIGRLLNQAGVPMKALDAVAVSAGPGSYTGLRVGMASAKGLCYAISKPLICLNTLTIMAISAKTQIGEGAWFCPMIDARRMEVFTALYNNDLEVLLPPQAMILKEDSFSSWLDQNKIIFFGNGAGKYKELLKKPEAVFENLTLKSSHAAGLAAQMFADKAFSMLAYAEPFYLKPFFMPESANS